MSRAVTFRELLALHLAPAVPLFALSLWFGVLDVPETDEVRCNGCGVEAYVIVAHVLAALWIGAAVAAGAALHARAAGRDARPGRVTLAILALTGAYLAASLVRHQLFDLFGMATMLASLIAGPAVAGWWLVVSVLMARRPRDRPASAQEVHGALVRAWLSLLVLLPALFAFVWTSRVDWFAF